MNITKYEQIGKCFKKYKRPDLKFSQTDQDLHLMATDFHNYTEEVQQGKTRSVMLINCLDKNENTFLVQVNNFNIYFYVLCPENLEEPAQKDFFKAIENHINKISQKKVVESITLVFKESFLEYKVKEKEIKYLKIVLNDYEAMSKIKSSFEKGIELSNRNYQSATYETNVNYLLRFLTDKNISGNSWITLPKNKYEIISKKGSCQITLEIDEKDLISNNLEDPEFSTIAPLRIMSFDIECSSYGKLPNPDNDSIITIGIVCKLHHERQETFNVVFQLGSCEEIFGCDLYTFNNEDHLLAAFDEFIKAYDPDIFMGYNILNFDMHYLLKRRKACMNKNDFAFWGRLDEITEPKMGKFNSKIMGFRETFEYDVFGRTIIDIYIHMLNSKKLRSYKLNSVSYEILNEQKEDVHHSMISTLQDGNAKTRNRLATYCLKDAMLPLRISEKLKCIYNYVEMARVTGVPLNFLFRRGQQIRIKAQILKELYKTNLIFPNYRSKVPTDGIGYQGADVLQPKSGFYNCPITTLDFASLYPSIMISHNFCYSTLINSQNIKSLKPDQFITTPNGHYFIKKEIRKGILPEILENLLNARKIAKNDLAMTKRKLTELKALEIKTETNEQEIAELENMESVLDGRQLALKISANSVYGFTGAQKGSLPCLEIASSVTSIGRQMIEKTRNFILEHYSVRNGYEFDADVIYGDTDSVMINFGIKDVKRTMELGREAAELLSDKFVKPIKLEFEKIYYPYLLLTKKRYAGLLWTKPDKPDYKDCKGLESVRRDNCLLVRTMVDKVLDIILYEKDFKKAIDYTKGIIFDLYNNRIDISMLIISKSLSKDIEGENGYSSNQAHVELAKKIMKRTHVKFNIGDRIPFVILSKTKKSKNFEKSEDPSFAFENNLPLDLDYYLEKQIKPPLERIFCTVIDTKTIFEGDHTRIKVEQKVSDSKGLGMFFKKVEKFCLNCKKALPDKAVKPVCESCTIQEFSLIMKNTLNLKAKEREYQRLWSECQRCEGSLLTEVTCSNSSCPIYFRRGKLQNDIEDCYKTIEKFNYI